MYHTHYFVIILLLGLTACSPTGQSVVSAQPRAAPESATPQSTITDEATPPPTSAPTDSKLVNPLPPTSEETIDLLEFIAAEQARTREAMSAFDFKATEQRHRDDGKPGGEKFVFDRVVTVVRARADQFLLTEEEKDALMGARTATGASTVFLRNSGKPLVIRYLRLPDKCVVWANVLQPQLTFQNQHEWADWEADRCSVTLHAIDPAVLATTMGGAELFPELAASLRTEGDANWRWDVVKESETVYRVSQWSRWERDYLLNSFWLDMGKGGVLTQATCTPKKGTGGMGRTVHKTYTSIDGVYLLQEHVLQMLDDQGKQVEDIKITYSHYERSDPKRVFTLGDLQTPADAFFSRMLPDRKAGGGVQA